MWYQILFARYPIRERERENEWFLFDDMKFVLFAIPKTEILSSKKAKTWFRHPLLKISNEISSIPRSILITVEMIIMQTRIFGPRFWVMLKWLSQSNTHTHTHEKTHQRHHQNNKYIYLEEPKPVNANQSTRNASITRMKAYYDEHVWQMIDAKALPYKNCRKIYWVDSHAY